MDKNIGDIIFDIHLFNGVRVYQIKTNNTFNLKCNVKFLERHSQDDITYKLYHDNVKYAESMNYNNYITVIEAKSGFYNLASYMFNPNESDEFLDSVKDIEDKDIMDTSNDMNIILDDINTKCFNSKNAVAINGAFFNEITYKPLGMNASTYITHFNIKKEAETIDDWILSINDSYYNNCNDVKNNPKKYIPFETVYSDYTAYFGIDQNNLPYINRKVKYNSVIYKKLFMQSAPLLVENGQVVFNSDDCRKAMFLYHKKDPADQTRILDHSCNFNPRTAVGVKKDNTLLFVMVEGRGNRGIGMDITMLSCLMKRLECEQALNLDGGKSSNVFINTGNGFEAIRTNNDNLNTFQRVSDFLPNIFMLTQKR